ncbi:gamma-aminobutyric acid receptor-associated protein-like 2, partial [Panonychus citri]|uniref:gamma-aminobutyric acid receptor-associated protein-like 2 n=1 Tax=Panonychus citri TaxID=50023 RepID=UPI002307A69A
FEQSNYIFLSKLTTSFPFSFFLHFSFFSSSFSFSLSLSLSFTSVCCCSPISTKPLQFLSSLVSGQFENIKLDYSRKGSPVKWVFKEKYNLEQRKKESTVIREKYPDKIPIIAQKSPKSHLKDLDKYKLLIPYEVTVAQLMYLLRDRLKLTQKESIYLFIDRTLPQSSALIGELWYRHRDEDGFLYVMFSEENTFGSRQN